MASAVVPLRIQFNEACNHGTASEKTAACSFAVPVGSFLFEAFPVARHPGPRTRKSVDVRVALPRKHPGLPRMPKIRS